MDDSERRFVCIMGRRLVDVTKRKSEMVFGRFEQIGVLQSWCLQKGVVGLVEEEMEVDYFRRLKSETVVVVQK